LFNSDSGSRASKRLPGPSTITKREPKRSITPRKKQTHEFRNANKAQQLIQVSEVP
jgi:hypothetical protein